MQASCSPSRATRATAMRRSASPTTPTSCACLRPSPRRHPPATAHRCPDSDRSSPYCRQLLPGPQALGAWKPKALYVLTPKSVEVVMAKSELCQWSGLRFLYLAITGVVWIFGGGRRLSTGPPAPRFDALAPACHAASVDPCTATPNLGQLRRARVPGRDAPHAQLPRWRRPAARTRRDSDRQQ